MNEPRAVYVRARDGALYLNPVLSFPEGFVTFGNPYAPELFLWLPSTPLEKAPDADTARAVLARVFGFPVVGVPPTAYVSTLEADGRGECPIPGTDPVETRPAIAFFFSAIGRTPRPVLHEGTERHASRVRDVGLYDWPPSPHDALQLEVPVLEEGGQP